MNVHFSRKRSFRILENYENEGPLSAISSRFRSKKNSRNAPFNTLAVAVDLSASLTPSIQSHQVARSCRTRAQAVRKAGG